MKIYKAGTRYFSTYQEAKTYREKYFSSARWIETINVEENTIKSNEDIVVRVHWYKSDHSGGLYVRSYWCVGALSDFLKTDSNLNVLSISRPQEGTAFVYTHMAFRNMGAARYRIKTKKLLDFLEAEISKIPVGDKVQIKI
jgi:hypothetical protein